MGLFKQLARSAKKSKFMKEVIREELKTYELEYDSDKAQIARKALYDYLCQDEILCELARKFTFEQFDNSMSYLKAYGFKYSKSGDYIPVATFCFLNPLAFSVNFFIDKTFDQSEYFMLLTSYFGGLLY